MHVSKSDVYQAALIYGDACRAVGKASMPGAVPWAEYDRLRGEERVLLSVLVEALDGRDETVMQASAAALVSMTPEDARGILQRVGARIEREQAERD